jgi:hypothetical protein
MIHSNWPAYCHAFCLALENATQSEESKVLAANYATRAKTQSLCRSSYFWVVGVLSVAGCAATTEHKRIAERMAPVLVNT